MLKTVPTSTSQGRKGNCSGETLTDKVKTIHERGLVSVLKQIHDELDAAVFDAYGWPVTLTDEEILERLVALNAERAAEEARGLIRWLRPDFQNRSQQTQQAIDIEESSDDEAARQGEGIGQETAAPREAVRTGTRHPPATLDRQQTAHNPHNDLTPAFSIDGAPATPAFQERLCRRG